jgi:hypothetical protein
MSMSEAQTSTASWRARAIRVLHEYSDCLLEVASEWPAVHALELARAALEEAAAILKDCAAELQDQTRG